MTKKAKKIISVVIPVYRNKVMFMKHLKHNLPMLTEYEVIVVDDASGEGIAESVEKKFPKVRVIRNKKNLGFAPTVNIGCKAASGDFIILLNSDVKMIKRLPSLMVKKFKEDAKLFAISFRQIEKDGSSVGRNRLYFKDGFPAHEKIDSVKSGLNAWAEGGACVIRASYFKRLNGFNENFAPFYWEDIDLSYRAYARGWYVYFDENIVVEHHHESTIGKFFSKYRVRRIAFRNQLLFTWANITDDYYIKEHYMRILYVLFSFTAKGRLTFTWGFLAALLKLPWILRYRFEKKKTQKRTDEEILSLFRR